MPRSRCALRGPEPRLAAGQEDPFRFVLLNAYYLQEEAARGRLDLVDETFAKAKRLGARVVRTWAFNDDPGKKDTAIQVDRLVYSERGLLGLDRVLERARAHGLRLILALVNYWDAYGGARQWVKWNGLRDPREGDGRFFTEPARRAHYAAHVEALLGRVNPLTRTRYAEDATVLAWELMNEPQGRGLDRDGARLADWIAFAASTVRGLGALQLVSVGDAGHDVSFEGYDGEFWSRIGGRHLFEPALRTSFRRNLASPDVDIASCHFYPELAGVRRGREEEAGCLWIAEHARIARGMGKPLVIGEFGLRNEGRSLAERRRIYSRWLESAIEAGVAGVGPWLFAYDERPESWDQFTFRLHSGTSIDDPRNRYADIVAGAAGRLASA